ncbi:hypothetical protein FEM48_Zijuj09G0112400 [Ziziphus jujuba var. spinosa]|uniref:Uncharacterized protein n=1 Tax=Ziziphus jujuba var. spinosa TaxID=714518 RepID=A0A978USP3_ZIZJJ|nr:hypothetical protein FEM48_Zijuj09G0112400 [Ziziphus jujuba var. spinosa]
MGLCSSFQHPNKNRALNLPSTAIVIHLDGSLQEFKQPIKAAHILNQNPSCFLCCSDSMHIDSQLPRIYEDEELQLGQIYFLLPISYSQKQLSLQELCSLAIKASEGLAHLDMGNCYQYSSHNSVLAYDLDGLYHTLRMKFSVLDCVKFSRISRRLP